MADWEPIADIAAKVKAGQLKAVDLVERSLAEIAKQESYKAIIATTEDRARERAKRIDAQVADGEDPGRLAGVPFIAKDNFLVFGANTTAGFNQWAHTGGSEMWFQAGFAARNAVAAVRLAESGAFTSPTALDGEAGRASRKAATVAMPSHKLTVVNATP